MSDEGHTGLAACLSEQVVHEKVEEPTEVTAPEEGEGVVAGGGEAGGDGELASAAPGKGLLDAIVLAVFGCNPSADDIGDAVDEGDPPSELDVTYP